nr:hypothetical protein Iba_chr01eCG6760 [Ipomoea batatas]
MKQRKEKSTFLGCLVVLILDPLKPNRSAMLGLLDAGRSHSFGLHKPFTHLHFHPTIAKPAFLEINDFCCAALQLAASRTDSGATTTHLFLQYLRKMPINFMAVSLKVGNILLILRDGKKRNLRIMTLCSYKQATNANERKAIFS